MSGNSQAPSWPKVLATTFRLWFTRRVLPPRERTAGTPPDRTKWVIAGLVIFLAATAVGTEIATARDSDHKTTRSADPKVTHNAALAAAAADRQLAAAWITAQVSPGVIVSCDPLMCSALQQDGFPAANLEQLGPGAIDPLGSGIVVSTAAIRNQIGPRLSSVYAPIVIASFGRGTSAVQVRVVAPDGAAAQLSADRDDILARRAAGRQLLHNRNVHLSAVARQQLSAGLVDSRLLITMAALAADYPVYVRQFGDAGPGAPVGTPLRSMTIRAWVPLRHDSPASYRRLVLAFLRAQRAPLLARTQVLGNGTRTALRIEFTAPSVLGLLGAHSQS